jgi:general secretion pathway protein C
MPVQLQPNISNGQAAGLLVSPGSDAGVAFRQAGFLPGDVIIAVNGQPVASVGQAQSLLARSTGEIVVSVNRGGRVVPLRVRF